jgi:serine/threonine protein kinase
MVLADLLAEQGIQVECEIPAGENKKLYAGRKKDGTQIILKTAPLTCTEGEEDLEKLMVEHEYDVHSSISPHPNIAPAHGLFKLQESELAKILYVLAVGYVPGKNLDEAAEDFYNSEDGDARYFKALSGAIKGLKHLHSNDVLHLDIKPQNIMVNKQGEGVLIDFGISLNMKKGYPGIMRALVFGTPQYIAPEQMRREVGRQSDIFQLGATVIQGVACTAPYQMVPVDDTVEQDYNLPVPIENCNRALRNYSDFLQLLEKSRSTDPLKRPSLDEFASIVNELEKYFRNHPEHERLLPRDAVSQYAPTRR